MITLVRDGKRMEVATELQASVMERSGYTRVEPEKPVSPESPKSAPPKRRRSVKTEEAE